MPQSNISKLVDMMMQPIVLQEIDRIDGTDPLADLKDALKSVLYHFGPSGADKVVVDVLEARKRRQS